MNAETDTAVRALAGVAGELDALELLVLFGSRARGDARPSSDWDLAYVARPALDPEALRLAAVRSLGSDAVDVVDLARAGALVRFRAARDGVCVFERRPGAFAAFQEEAATFYCDMEPLLRRAWGGVLGELG